MSLSAGEHHQTKRNRHIQINRQLKILKTQMEQC